MDDSASLPPGSRLADRYVVDSVLGRGGMSVVYRARDESLGRIVAIKVFSAGVADAATVARQRSEVQLVASFSHPTLITLFDAVIDESDGTERAFLVMQYVDGAVLPHGPLDESTVTAIGADVADALAYVHERGVIHRDVKPGNILVPRESRASAPSAFLADFGIARFVDGVAITTAGAVLGTASYLSPEQALGRPLAPSTDIYSLGLVLIEALSGRPGFSGLGMEAVAARLTRDPQIPESVSPRLAALIGAMTAADPSDRPRADEVEAELRSGSEPELAATVVMAQVADDATMALPEVGYAPTTLLPVAPVMPAASTERLTDTPPVAASARPRFRRPMIIAAALLVIALAGGVAAAITSNRSPDAVSTSPVPNTPASPAPAQSTGATPVATTLATPVNATPTPDATEPAATIITPPGKDKDKDKDTSPGKGHGKKP